MDRIVFRPVPCVAKPQFALFGDNNDYVFPLAAKDQTIVGQMETKTDYESTTPISPNPRDPRRPHGPVEWTEGQTVHGGLGHVVEQVAEVLVSVPGRCVNDQAAAVGKHQWDGPSGGHEVRPHPGLEHAGPVPERLLPEGGDKASQVVLFITAPDVVDQNVEAALLLRDAGE